MQIHTDSVLILKVMVYIVRPHKLYTSRLLLYRHENISQCHSLAASGPESGYMMYYLYILVLVCVNLCSTILLSLMSSGLYV